MSERRKNERRKWGRKVTYPFIDSDGVLVTKNRRRLIDRRLDTAADHEAVPVPPTLTDAETSLDISESKVMELEEALKTDNGPASKIDASIKDLESQILTTTTEKKAAAKIDMPASELGNISSATNTSSTQTATKSAAKPKPAPVVKKIKNEACIELSFKGSKHVLSGKKDSYQVGRDPTCDIIIQGKHVSRAHAKIIYKEGKFFLQDNSFNGTYIKFDNGQKIHVSKNEQTLIADGVMSMGKPVQDNSKSIIQFKIVQ